MTGLDSIIVCVGLLLLIEALSGKPRHRGGSFRGTRRPSSPPPRAPPPPTRGHQPAGPKVKPPPPPAGAGSAVQKP